MNSLINNYCLKMTVEGLRHMNPEEWLEKMISNFPNVNENEVSDSQVEAWKDSFHVLQTALEGLPDTYNGIHVIFEYVLPKYIPKEGKKKLDPGVRPDVLMISSDTVTVLEFKRLEKRYNGCEAQTRKYRRRIQKWHVQSVGMNKKAILVFTKAKNLEEQHFRVYECSPDMLGEKLKEYYGEKPEAMTNGELDKWIHSDYIDRDEKSKDIEMTNSLKRHHLERLQVSQFDCLGGREHSLNIEINEDKIVCEEITSSIIDPRKEIKRYELTEGINQWLFDMNKTDLEKWDGSDYIDKNIIDGGSWSVTYQFSDQKPVRCGGNIWPEGWTEFFDVIERLKKEKNKV